MNKYLAAALAAFALAAPVAAQAQEAPSYAQPQYAEADAEIQGRIASFDGAYDLTVRDEAGYLDNVQLQQGTIINPTGITLAPGMIVNILGYSAGPYFAATEVDTPYTFYGAVPYYYGHPWNYYGPSISLSFFFGHTGWWHAPAWGGGYHLAGGTRVSNTVRVNNVYHGANVHQGSNVERGTVVRPFVANGGSSVARGGGLALAVQPRSFGDTQSRHVQVQHVQDARGGNGHDRR